MAALVEVADFCTYAGIDTADSTVAQAILDGTEALLLAGLGRRHAPFAAAASSRTEMHDGTGSIVLVLHYPIDTATGITSIKVSDETGALVLVPSTAYTYVAGGRRVLRTDGELWGAFQATDAVEVVYKSEADLPPAARTAVLRVAAAIYRQRGAEDVSSDSEGPYSATYSRAAQDDAVWRMVLDTHYWTIP